MSFVHLCFWVVLMRVRNNIEVVDKSVVLKDQGYPTGLK